MLSKHFQSNSEADCFFLCIDEAGIQFREGVTQHQVKQEQSIGSFVFMSKIPSIIPYFSTPVQIILKLLKWQISNINQGLAKNS